MSPATQQGLKTVTVLTGAAATAVSGLEKLQSQSDSMSSQITACLLIAFSAISLALIRDYRTILAAASLYSAFTAFHLQAFAKGSADCGCFPVSQIPQWVVFIFCVLMAAASLSLIAIDKRLRSANTRSFLVVSSAGVFLAMQYLAVSVHSATSNSNAENDPHLLQLLNTISLTEESRELHPKQEGLKPGFVRDLVSINVRYGGTEPLSIELVPTCTCQEFNNSHLSMDGTSATQVTLSHIHTRDVTPSVSLEIVAKTQSRSAQIIKPVSR